MHIKYNMQLFSPVPLMRRGGIKIRRIRIADPTYPKGWVTGAAAAACDCIQKQEPSLCIRWLLLFEFLFYLLAG